MTHASRITAGADVDGLAIGSVTWVIKESLWKYQMEASGSVRAFAGRPNVSGALSRVRSRS
jgi:hypothetical protein